MKLTLIALLALALFTLPSQARLGETEVQSDARYGASNPDLIAATDKPLLPGAEEKAYLFQGWRVRAAFVGGETVRIEYVNVADGQPKKLGDAEIKAVLDAEAGKFSWREQKPRTGNKDLNALKTFFDGRNWERSDHAEAMLLGGILLVLETRDADRVEKKLESTAGRKQKAPPAPTVPKF